MIRPITVICWVLALSAGLYLYRAKHEVELMDKHIEQIAKQTEDLRLQSRQMLDDWIRLGEPEQLHKYSDAYLGLKTIAPTQFARLSDLPTRLPAPQADPPVEQPDVVAKSVDDPSAAAAGEPPPPMVATEAPSTDTDAATEADAQDMPIPPIPPAVLPPGPPVTTVALPAVTAVPLQARPVTPRLTNAQPDAETARPHVAAPARIAEEPHATETKPQPVTLAEPRVSPSVQANTPAAGTAASPPRAVPPLQAQGPRNVQGLPPLQAQGAAVGGQAQVQGVAQDQRQGFPANRPVENRTADNRENAPRWDARPVPSGPPLQQAQMPQPRGYVPEPRVAAQAPMPAAAPSQGTSLLGMSRGTTVPLPLPAPTPVSATWPGQGR